MKKFKYLKISKTKKLRFIDNYFKKKLYIVFLHGFMSDIEGRKPQTLLRFAKKNKLGFLALEYSGHGKSTGKFTKGNISIWTNDTNKLIKRVVKKNNANYYEWGEASDRFFEGIELAKKFPNLPIIFTSGLLPWSNIALSEGEFLANYTYKIFKNEYNLK